MENIALSDGEWRIMKLLWERSPYTLGALAKELEKETGWTRPTVFVMLKRLIAKGAVRVDEEAKVHEYYPDVARRDVTSSETASFLERVYDGSVGMLFSALTERTPISDEELAELRRILDEAEKKRKE